MPRPLIKILLFFFLCFSPAIPLRGQGQGQGPGPGPGIGPAVGTPYNFFYTRIKIGPEEYQHYIRPQIKGMIGEFISSFRALHPYYPFIFQVQESLAIIHGKFFEWQNTPCSENRYEACYLLLKDLYQQFRGLDSLILHFQDISPFFRPPEAGRWKPAQTLGLYFSFIPELDELSNISFQILHLLESGMISYSMNRPSILEKAPRFSLLMNQWEVYFQQILFLGLPPEFQNHFQMVWVNFFKILNKNVPAAQQIKIMENSLEDLNFSWNNFHLVLSKGPHRPPQEILSSLVNIHTRWNSILKIILR